MRVLRFAATAFALAILVSVSAFAPMAAADPLLAYGARIAGDEARTRIVIDMDRAPAFTVHYLDNPVRIVVDLPATAFGFPAGDLKHDGCGQRPYRADGEEAGEAGRGEGPGG